MMLLLLPYELQMQIIDYVSPRDLPSLSLSCKHLRAASRNHLREHNTYTRRLSENPGCASPANVQRRETNQAFSTGAPQLLLDIAQNPRLARYVEKLVRDQLDGEGSPGIPWDLGLRLAKRVLQQSRIVLEEDEVCDWIHAVANASGGAVLGLLLGQLTELRRMQLGVRVQDPITPYVPRAVSRLAMRSQKGHLDQPLSGLEEVRIECWSYDSEDEDSNDGWSGSEGSQDQREQRTRAVLADDHYQQMIRLLAALARLPSLRTLSVMDYYSQPVWQESRNDRDTIIVDWDDAMDPAYPLPLPKSGLESMIVDRGNISGPALSRIIEGCSNFKRFKYNVFHTPEVFGRLFEGVRCQPHLPHMSVEAVCMALVTHAKSTLHHLHIELMEYGSMCGCRHEPCLQPNSPYISINPSAPATTNWKWNEFTRLERLTLDIDLFSNLPDSGWLPFAQTMPVSIQDIVILAPRCPPEADRRDFENMFRDFKPQAFPSLRSISAWHRNQPYNVGHNGAQHILAVYLQALDRAGIPPMRTMDYSLSGEYFREREKNNPYRWEEIVMNEFGKDDYHLYALPGKDLEKKLVLGVYHSEGDHRARDNVYSGIMIEKSWD
ncbi:F-box domain protein [Aspergillus bertholletiae]|uniref:F-box domain protein n=1 Tax=Aspergillus bertholletiae TaxID=1226010 RepID=A0A5N7B8G4_9EURO|nr:F-box domain protein [Aspergillus bertholletiae]